jgi:hypothetical protein
LEFPSKNWPSTCILTLQNKSSEKNIAFKIKTTAPKCYLVKPNIGVCKPNETLQVHITNHVQEGDQPGNPGQDKFLVLTTPVDFEQGISPDQLTSFFNTVNNTQLTQHKLEVGYKDKQDGNTEMPIGQPEMNAKLNSGQSPTNKDSQKRLSDLESKAN